MAIAHVGSNHADLQGSGNNFNFVVGTPFVAGNHVFVRLACISGAVTTGMDDNLGNVWSLVYGITLQSRRVELWRCSVVIGGNSTINTRFSTNKGGVGICVSQYSCAPGFVLALDQNTSNSAAAPGTTSYPHGSITTTQANELILTAARLLAVGVTVTADAAYTNRGSTFSTGSVICSDKIVSSTLTTNPTPTGTGNSGYAALVASFYEVLDSSGLRLSQMPRTELYAGDGELRLDQMVRTVLYTFTCEPGPVPSIGQPGCPAALPLLPVTPPPGCPDEV